MSGYIVSLSPSLLFTRHLSLLLMSHCLTLESSLLLIVFKLLGLENQATELTGLCADDERASRAGAQRGSRAGLCPPFANHSQIVGVEMARWPILDRRDIAVFTALVRAGC